jgi:hypothetical protein
MSTGDTTVDDDQIRETYEEFTVGETRIAILTDPENDTAWIQSDLTEEIQR